MDSINLKDLAGGKIFCDFFGFVIPTDETIYPGAEKDLFIKSVKVGQVKVMAVRKFKVFQMRDVLCALETGEADVKLFTRRLSAHHGVIKPDDDLLHVAVKYTKKDFDVLNTMATEWWNVQQVF
jgi:hypothetical protein